MPNNKLEELKSEICFQAAPLGTVVQYLSIKGNDEGDPEMQHLYDTIDSVYKNLQKLADF